MCMCYCVCGGHYQPVLSKGLSPGEIGVRWDVRVSIELFMNGTTNAGVVCKFMCSVIWCVVQWSLCVSGWQSQWLYYYLLECIFSFTLIDVNNPFKELSVEHTCNTMS